MGEISFRQFSTFFTTCATTDKMNRHFRKINRLRTKFLLIMVPTVVVCFLIYSVFSAILTYRDERQNIINELQNQVRVQSAVLAKSLWELNFAVTRQYAESILLNREVSGVQVSELTTGTVIKIGSVPENHHDPDFFEVQSEIVFESPAEQQHVGILRLVSRKDLTLAPLVSIVLRDTVLLFLLVSAIIASAVAANRIVMNEPLNRLLESIRRADDEKIRNPVDWQSGDELGRVISAYNDLLQTLNVTEEKLKKSEEQYRTVFETTGTATVIIENDTTLSLVNSTFEALCGYSKQEVENKMKWTQFVVEEDLKRMLEYHRERRMAGKSAPENYQFRFVDRNGDIKHIYNRIRTIPRTDKSVASLMDITHLKEAEENLRHSEERIRSLVEISSDWVWEVDQHMTYTFASPKIKELLGYEPDDIIGRKIIDLISPDQKADAETEFKNIFLSGKPFRNLEMTVLHRNGTPVVIETNGVPVLDSDSRLAGYRGIDRDVTDRKRIQEMIVQSEKMLSIGGLAAGMAHEINNPLAGILQNIQLIQNRTSALTTKNAEAAHELGTSMETIIAFHEKRGVFRMIESVRDAGTRAAKIVENMLSFSRKEKSRRVPIRLSELLDKTLELIENDYNIKKRQDFRQIEVLREYEDAEHAVFCESSKIQQVFLNILKNGADAMADHSAENPQFRLRVKPDRKMVTVEIEDNGPGMDEATRKRVFEPFFTTKDVGLGTGLGLSVSYFIVTEDHNGTMNVESTPGQGTTFIIQLPFDKRA